ncbi:MAG: zinc-ribbon domain-containing protein [Deltaproteobacteria bacterium]|nr:zinc-ribbon domain-containing protein [Deltaproteobacteria bacterium]
MTFLAGKKTTCSNCGTEYDDPVVFCGACGARIAQKPANVGAPAAAPTASAPTTGSAPLTPQKPEVKYGATQRDVPKYGAAVKAAVRQEPKPEPAAPAQAQPPRSVRRSTPPPSSKTGDPKQPKKRKSTRPTAPDIAEWGADPDHEQKLLDEVDAGFYSIVKPRSEQPSDDDWSTPSDPALKLDTSEFRTLAQPADGPAHAAPDPVDVAAAVELFEQLAPIYARPIRDFMMEVTWGDATKAWLAVCGPAARSLRAASDKMDLVELRTALDDFLASVQLAEAEEGAMIAGTAKEMVTGAYDKLVTVMPHVFGLEEERGRREPMIVHSLLQQVPGVGKVTLDKIYAAGLTRLDMLYAAKPDEVAVTAGIAIEVARAICGRFQSYRTEVQQLRPDGGRLADRKKLEALARELRVLNDAFKGASSGWSTQAAKDKRWLRTERERIFLEIKVVLARSGDVDLLQQLERLPFERKAAHLETFLRDTRTKGQSP